MDLFKFVLVFNVTHLFPPFSLDSCVVLVFESKCPLVCPGRAEGAPAGDSLIPMTGAISAETGAITPMTAIASARGVVEAGKN